MGGASVQTGTQAVSYTQQIGIEDADLDDAREFYRLACERNKGHFGALIDGLYFREDDRRRSDLVYINSNGRILHLSVSCEYRTVYDYHFAAVLLFNPIFQTINFLSECVG